MERGGEGIHAAWKKIWREIRISNRIGYSRKKGGEVKFHSEGKTRAVERKRGFARGCLFEMKKKKREREKPGFQGTRARLPRGTLFTGRNYFCEKPGYHHLALSNPRPSPRPLGRSARRIFLEDEGIGFSAAMIKKKDNVVRYLIIIVVVVVVVRIIFARQRGENGQP